MSFLESLITPELWLKNCKTRSPTPEDYERHSKSSSPMTVVEEKLALSNTIDSKQTIPSSSSKVTPTVSNMTYNDNNVSDAGKKPIINVLPSSKLLSRNMLYNRSFRKRRVSNRLTISNKANPNDNNSGSTESIMNTTFPADLRAKIHSQMNNNPKSIQSTNFNRPPPVQQFMLRPPVNLFKYRLPFSIPPRIPLTTPQNQQPPPEDSNVNHLPFINPVIPPPVVLVPYPIPLPIILPIPLPLTAFMRAYQSKESELQSNENDNESHEEKTLEKMNENEKPLDLSSEQSINENDRILPAQHEDDCEDDDTDDTNIASTGNYSKRKKLLHDAVQSSDLTEVNVIKNLPNNMHERNRPLRKRKIFSADDNDEH